MQPHEDGAPQAGVKRSRTTLEQEAHGIIGARITSAREAVGLTRKQLAVEVGITAELMTHHETNRARIGLIRLMRVAEATRQPITYFVEGLVV